MGSNLDLVAISLTSIAIAILGIIVFVNNKRSATNRTFLVFAFLTILYALFNFMSNQENWSVVYILWFLRLTIFFAIWHALSIFHLFLVFPKQNVPLPLFYKRLVWPVVIATAILTLTPYIFAGVEYMPSVNQVAKASHGPAIPIFGLASAGLVVGAVLQLFKKTRRATSIERIQYRLILIGTVTTFSFILLFSLILPTVYEILIFIPFAPLFFFPFIILTAYAIIKYRLLDIKTIATELLTFALWILLLVRLLAAREVYDIALSVILFLGALSLGILLIRSVLQEVKIREVMEEMAVRLEVANDELKKVDEAKSDFISIASHQLRTPLSIIKGYISMVREGTYGKVSDKLMDPLQKVYISNERLINLVADLLDLSRMERGKMVYDYKIVQMIPLVNSLAIDFKVVAKKKGLSFTWEPRKIRDYVRADENKIRQVILNLIDNAVKYTLHGSIALTLKEEGNDLRFSVTDTGPGLSQDEQLKLFQKFARGQSEQKTHTEGLGLGLYVARLIAQAHYGDLSVDSPGKGKGSTFSLTLPIYSGSDTTVKV